MHLVNLIFSNVYINACYENLWEAVHCSKTVWNSLTVAFRTSLSYSIKPVTLFIPCLTKGYILYVIWSSVHFMSLNIFSHLFTSCSLLSLISHHLHWISAVTSNRSPLFPHSWHCSQCTDLTLSHLHYSYRLKPFMCRTKGYVWPEVHLSLWPNLTQQMLMGLPHSSEPEPRASPLSWKKWTNKTIQPLPHTTYKN